MSDETRPKHKLRVPRARRGAVKLLVGTRKGAFAVESDTDRKKWELTETWFLGSVVNHVVMDPRDERTVLATVRSGHLGPTLLRSEDGGKKWREVRRPPAFDEAPPELAQRTVNHVFWLTPGPDSEPGTWYAGTSPQGLFRSTDGGKSWRPVNGLHHHPDFDRWTGGEQDGTPDGPKLHSVVVDPRDGAHLYVGMSSGGVFESTDSGASWVPLNRGLEADFMAPREDGQEHEFGHDPHLVTAARTNPDRLWQQNHCGVYRMDREEGRWERVGAALPKDVGDIGFPIVSSPFDPDTAWVFPMDGTDVWPRTSPGGAPAVYRTEDAGSSWARQDAGFPREHAWWTVKRQCMAQDQHDPLGLYLGTSSGEIWASTQAGKRWKNIVRHLPHIYSVEVAGVV